MARKGSETQIPEKFSQMHRGRGSPSSMWPDVSLGCWLIRQPVIRVLLPYITTTTACPAILASQTQAIVTVLSLATEEGSTTLTRMSLLTSLCKDQGLAQRAKEGLGPGVKPVCVHTSCGLFLSGQCWRKNCSLHLPPS